MNHMERLCTKCNNRPVQHMVEYGTGITVGICKCDRLWENGEPRQQVTYWTGGEIMRLTSGDPQPRKVKAQP